MRDVAVAAFAVVAFVGAAISYDHVQTVAAGEWSARVLPLSIDGLLVAGSLALWLERRDGHRGSVLAWASVILGLLASLGANLAASRPEWLSREGVDTAVALWPPVALALAFELLVRVSRYSHQPAAPAAGPPIVAPAPDSSPATTAPPPPPAPDTATTWTVDQAADWALGELRRNRTAGWSRISSHTGLKEYLARKAAKQAKDLHARPVRSVTSS